MSLLQIKASLALTGGVIAPYTFAILASKISIELQIFVINTGPFELFLSHNL